MAEANIRLERKGGFTVLQNGMLRDPRLSLKTKGLFAVMVSLPGDWRYSINGLATANGVGRDSIRTALVELEKAGYLSRQRIQGGGGKFEGIEYVLREESMTPWASNAPQSENPTMDAPQSGFPSSVEPAADEPSSDEPPSEKPTLQNKDLSITPYKSPKERSKRVCTDAHQDEVFEAFWRAYPRKVNKTRARRAWDKLSPDMALCRKMGAALALFKASPDWQRDDGAYIPHPATWLNNRRWEDEDIQSRPPERPPDAAQHRWGWD